MVLRDTAGSMLDINKQQQNHNIWWRFLALALANSIFILVAGTDVETLG